MSFDISVVDFPAKHLVGMKIRTDMQKAAVDCPTLWTTFGPRIAEIFSSGSPCGCSCGCSGGSVYGISVMINENEFDYWAAVEVAADAAVPAGMLTTDIPAGSYARCTISSLEKLGEAFMYVYGPWVAGQSEYAVNFQAPCFEQYPLNWKPENSLDIFVPVLKK